ncbi:MAG: glutaredoxin family protein [Porticoccus sp.]|nr:glutaredoxin family protein [Porticoccus sp.]
MSQILTLYTGPHCHLCEQAKSLIYPVLEGTDWRLQEVNIADAEELREKYGVRIPVIVTPEGQEKGWPFTVGQVKRLINSL